MTKWSYDCLFHGDCKPILIGLWLLLMLPGFINVVLYLTATRYRLVSEIMMSLGLLTGTAALTFLGYPISSRDAQDFLTLGVVLCALNIACIVSTWIMIALGTDLGAKRLQFSHRAFLVGLAFVTWTIVRGRLA